MNGTLPIRDDWHNSVANARLYPAWQGTTVFRLRAAPVRGREAAQVYPLMSGDPYPVLTLMPYTLDELVEEVPPGTARPYMIMDADLDCPCADMASRRRVALRARGSPDSRNMAAISYDVCSAAQPHARRTPVLPSVALVCRFRAALACPAPEAAPPWRLGRTTGRSNDGLTIIPSKTSRPSKSMFDAFG